MFCFVSRPRARTTCYFCFILFFARMAPACSRGPLRLAQLKRIETSLGGALRPPSFHSFLPSSHLTHAPSRSAKSSPSPSPPRISAQHTPPLPYPLPPRNPWSIIYAELPCNVWSSPFLLHLSAAVLKRKVPEAGLAKAATPLSLSLSFSRARARLGRQPAREDYERKENRASAVSVHRERKKEAIKISENNGCKLAGWLAEWLWKNKACCSWSPFHIANTPVYHSRSVSAILPCSSCLLVATLGSCVSSSLRPGGYWFRIWQTCPSARGGELHGTRHPPIASPTKRPVPLWRARGHAPMCAALPRFPIYMPGQ